MPGPRPKPADRRQRRNEPKKGQLGLPAGDSAGITQLPAPPAARHWSAGIKTQWRELWTHTLAQAIDRTVHLPNLRLLFDLRDEREKMAAITRAQPLVEGSMGNVRPHPLFARLGVVEAKIIELEKSIGLNPKAALDLGMQFNEMQRSLDDLARSAGADDELEDEDDPRLGQPVAPKAKIIEATAKDT